MTKKITEFNKFLSKSHFSRL